MRANMPCAVFIRDNGENCVMTVDADDDVCLPCDCIRSIKTMSKADQLLDRAIVACFENEEDDFFALPVRFGPSGRMWVLADAPYAPGMIDYKSGTDERA
jgi:hypothetical protein